MGRNQGEDKLATDKEAILREVAAARLADAESRCGGLCAAAATEALAGLLEIQPDDATLNAGLGLRFSGALGPALAAYTGAALLMAALARKNGLPQATTVALCKSWQQQYENLLAGQPGQPSAADVLLAAHRFMRRHQKPLGLEKELAKPRQYYDSIYTDRESMFRHSPYALEEKLAKAVTKGDEALALKALREISAHGEKAQLAKNPLRSVKNSLIGSIAFLARAAIQAGVSANDAFALSDALTQRVEEMTERQAVLDFEEHILLQYIALVRQRLEEAYSAPVVKVMHYVENHLDAKISLAQAAGYAGVHPAYLSARFKKETGLPFTRYVAARKIQESSYFVRHTGYSISQIASLYGFSSQGYYITTFKKVMAATPMEYRRSVLAE